MEPHALYLSEGMRKDSQSKVVFALNLQRFFSAVRALLGNSRLVKRTAMLRIYDCAGAVQS